MFDKMERRVSLFADDMNLKKEVRFLILHHLRASQYDRSWTDSAVRRFAREMGEYMDDLFCLSRADITTKRPERKRRGLRQINNLAERVSALASEAEQNRQVLPKGLGSAIMKEFDLPPSKAIGNLRDALEAEVRVGKCPANADIDVYLRYLRDHPHLLPNGS